MEILPNGPAPVVIQTTGAASTPSVINASVVGPRGPVGPTGPTGPSVTGPTGPEGPVGAVGIYRIQHGTDADVARPDYPVVYWVGSVAPVNAEPYDLWYAETV